MKLCAEEIKKCKGVRQLALITCYDYPTALCLEGLDLDLVLVGDSLGEVVYGMANTTGVTMEMMLRHTEAVRRGLPNTHLVADMPFRTYDTEDLALTNANRFKDAGADSVKLENPPPAVVEFLCAQNFSVMGHVGLTPQTMHEYRKQGKDEASAKYIFESAQRLSSAGCYCLIAEAVTRKVAQTLTAEIPVPVIGIASGKNTDGQIIVISDIIGIFKQERSYVEKYSDVRSCIISAVNKYITSVKSSSFGN